MGSALRFLIERYQTADAVQRLIVRCLLWTLVLAAVFALAQLFCCARGL